MAKLFRDFSDKYISLTTNNLKQSFWNQELRFPAKGEPKEKKDENIEKQKW